MGRKTLLLVGAVLAAALIALPAAAQEQTNAPAMPDITGNYILVSRDLPDGKTVSPPEVTGFLSLTGKYRNFNVMWKDPAGKMVSISYVCEYMLTPATYTEKPIMWIMTNEAGPEKVSYAIPPDKGKPNPVTLKDGAVSFPISGEPPVVTYTSDGMTATAAGQFTDHWKKVGGK
jgi:hypothetical protein